MGNSLKRNRDCPAHSAPPYGSWVIRFSALKCPPNRNKNYRSSVPFVYWSCPDWISTKGFHKLMYMVVQVFLQEDYSTIIKLIKEPHFAVELIKECSTICGHQDFTELENELLEIVHDNVSLHVVEDQLHYLDLIITDDFDPHHKFRRVLGENQHLSEGTDNKAVSVGTTTMPPCPEPLEPSAPTESSDRERIVNNHESTTDNGLGHSSKRQEKEAEIKEKGRTYGCFSGSLVDNENKIQRNLDSTSELDQCIASQEETERNENGVDGRTKGDDKMKEKCTLESSFKLHQCMASQEEAESNEKGANGSTMIDDRIKGKSTLESTFKLHQEDPEKRKKIGGDCCTLGDNKVKERSTLESTSKLHQEEPERKEIEGDCCTVVDNTVKERSTLKSTAKSSNSASTNPEGSKASSKVESGSQEQKRIIKRKTFPLIPPLYGLSKTSTRNQTSDSNNQQTSTTGKEKKSLQQRLMLPFHGLSRWMSKRPRQTESCTQTAHTDEDDDNQPDLPSTKRRRLDDVDCQIEDECHELSSEVNENVCEDIQQTSTNQNNLQSDLQSDDDDSLDNTGQWYDALE